MIGDQPAKGGGGSIFQGPFSKREFSVRTIFFGGGYFLGVGRGIFRGGGVFHGGIFQGDIFHEAIFHGSIFRGGILRGIFSGGIYFPRRKMPATETIILEKENIFLL